MSRPVAIIGAACRFPGSAVDLDGYWRLLDDRVDAVREVPSERWDPAKWLDPRVDAIGKTYSARGTFVSDIDRFDAWFFQISPREAKSISPEQRLLLEVAWEALENARVLPGSIREGAAGVFVGVAPTVYGDVFEGLIPARTDAYAVTGRLTSFDAGRLSYVLGFRGPSMAVDTACSSALVALHLACRSLQAGECSVAVVGAVNVLLNPISYVDMSRMRALSRSGACRAFDAGADGYVRGEGCGAVVLKLLDDALRDGDEVLAVIRGSAVNHDGASSGLTVPSRHAQEELLRAALRDAGLQPTDVDYVEAHGTGTPLGDPIEAVAIGTVLGEGRSADRPLLFGSVKTNLGHLESAAGMASLLKLVLALRHERLPAQLHLSTPNPAIPWAELPMRVATEPQPWHRREDRPRIAGVSAFGISGTNAHIIIEEPPLAARPVAVRVDDDGGALQSSAFPFLISAKSKPALQAQAARIRAFLEARPDARLVDVAGSLALTRTHFEERAVVVTADRSTLLEAVSALARGEASPALVTRQTHLPGKLVFVFAGHGAQWTEMARGLVESSSVFRESIERCAQALAPHVDWSLLDVLRGAPGAPDVERLDVVQPALFAMSVSLAAVWRSLGVEPDAVVGHSLGEIAAACVAGALTLEDAARIVALRGIVLARLEGKGAVASVELSLPDVQGRLARFRGRLSVAALNSPTSTLVSGEPQALDDLLAELRAAEIFARRVRIDYASHSPQIETVREELVGRMGVVCPRPSTLEICSTVTGSPIDGTELDGAYWYRNCRQEVRFADAIQNLLASGHRYFVEVSAHPVLTLALDANIAASGKEAVALGSLRREQGDWSKLVGSLGELHAVGYPVDWKAFFDRLGARNITLPTYAFQRKRFWLDTPKPAEIVSSGGGASGEHPFLGAAIAMAESDGILRTGRVSLAEHPWLRDHVIDGRTIFPATGFLELVLAAAERAGADEVEELTLEVPLVLAAKSSAQLQLWLGPEDAAGRRALSVHARGEDAADDAPWTRHAIGTVGPKRSPSTFDLREWPPPGAVPVLVDTLYDRLSAAGLVYGESFRGVAALWKTPGAVYAEIRLPEGSIRDAAKFAIHPALLDAALHPLALLDDDATAIALPFSWAGVRLDAAGASALRVCVTEAQERGSFALLLGDERGEPLGSIENLATRMISRGSGPHVLSSANLDSLYRIAWVPIEPTTAEDGRVGAAIWGVDELGLKSRLSTSGVSVETQEDLPSVARCSAQVVLVTRGPSHSSAEIGARTAAHEVLALVQAWLADTTVASKKLVIVTHGAVATDGEDGLTDLAHAAVWGLVRSAQSELSDRSIVLVDIDDGDLAALPSALASLEPQIALRGGRALVPRLVRARDAVSGGAQPFNPEGTVLITGGTGALGATLARHLVVKHGVRNLLLSSRQGMASSGTETLCAELVAAGAHVKVAACDVADREAVSRLLEEISPQHPLTAVIHAAGVVDDGVIDALTPARIDRVFSPKVDGAMHLHDATQHLRLSAFVLFSSAAGVAGAPGQGNYAAANAFLDALARRRRQDGLTATSLAWGYWAERSALTEHLTRADVARLGRLGLEPLSTEEGLSLFDAAMTSREAILVPVRLNRAILASTSIVPPLLRALVRPVRRAVGASMSGGALTTRLEAMTEADRARTVVELVRREIATVLGARPESIDARSALTDFGLDSLMAVELRNRLASATGLRLPATLLFDHPTLTAVARYVGEKLAPRSGAGVPSMPKAVPAVVSEAEDPIVVVAMSCRYPGGVRSPEQLWQFVIEGRDAISDFPTNRGWPSLVDLYDPDPSAKGKCYVRQGGFLHDADQFDPVLFGVSQREAPAIDPQQRLLLESTWEVFERARLAPSTLNGSRTGVFVGVMYNDYGARFTKGAGEYEGYVGIGSAPSVASGRIAYTFGLQGPAVTLDTACSSSLVALHLACQAIRTGECSMALAGGVTVMATPGAFVEFSRQRGLSVEGRCKAFGAGADGTIWGEGVGMLLLERMSDARRNGHPILAVIRGSAVNQDGKSQGLTAPNGPAQQRVIEQALASAGLSPLDIDVVEAHGTGTALGDPIEAEALLAIYGPERPVDRPLWLGSIKSNFGHTQAAAGVAGIIKMVLALEHDLLPKTLYADPPSPHVDWSAGTVRLLNEPVSWQENATTRRAAISSFGISGTNAHVIIEGVSRARAEVPEVGLAHASPQAFILSARTPTGRSLQAKRLREHLEMHPELRLVDVARSLATTRAHFEYRGVVVARDSTALDEGLGRLAESDASATAILGDVRSGGKLAVLFTGQGSQYAQMGQALYDELPAFRQALDAVCMELDPRLGRSLRELLFAVPGSTDAALLNETAFTQPALFALEVALYRVMESWGVVPSILLGHSVGEISAAHVSGVLDLADACSLIVERGRLMQALPVGGAMVALRASEAEVLPRLADRSDRVSIASVNGPQATVIAGDEEAVMEVSRHFEALGRKSSRLSVSHAFHSPLMNGMLARFGETLRGLRFHSPRIPIISNVTGREATEDELRSPAYWARHARDAVRFLDGMRALESDGVATFLELGPRGVLSSMGPECLDEPDRAAFLTALRSDRDGTESLLVAAGALWARGHAFDWNALHAPLAGRQVALPTYAFEHRRFWLDVPKDGNAAVVGVSATHHPLLEAMVATAETGSALFTGRLSFDDSPWLADHIVHGSVLVPGAVFVELGLAAAERLALDGIEELTMEAPLVIPVGETIELQLWVGSQEQNGCRSWTLHSRRGIAEDRGAAWTRHVTGRLGSARSADFELSAWPPPGATPVPVENVYERAGAVGLSYGDSFLGLTSVWVSGSDFFAEVSLPDGSEEASRFSLHPALLDAALQPIALTDRAALQAFVPFAWEGVRVYGMGATSLRVHIVASDDGDRVSVRLADTTGAAVARVDDIRLRPVTKDQLRIGDEASTDSLYRVDWLVSSNPSEHQPRRWAFAGNDTMGLVGRLAKLGVVVDSQGDVTSLSGSEADVVVVCPGQTTSHSLDERARAATHEMLAILQTWLTDAALSAKQLVIATRRAISTRPEETIDDLAGAAVWGLVRSAQSENPDRSIVLVDIDDDGDLRRLSAALSSGEPQLAIRREAVLVPRLKRAVSSSAASGARLHPEGTVLVTGGLGALGTMFARHLVGKYGIKNLLLTSRQGPSAPGAEALQRELEEAGARVTIAACDVGNRDEVARLLGTIEPSRPLTAIVHAAGVLDDGVIGTLSAARIDRVFAPKVDAAVHLHELTTQCELAAFVLFSSVAGVAGAPGQGNYAAANAFLDALAQHRHALGLPASSLAWGYWADRGALTAHLSAADLSRLARMGVEQMSPEEGLALFDIAVSRSEPTFVPMRLNGALLKAAEVVPPLLRELVRRPRRAAAAPAAPGRSALADRLVALPDGERQRSVLDLVRAETAVVLGANPQNIDPEAALKDFGLDSLMAVELRNRLAASTGLRLSATLLFDHPTPAALARHLEQKLRGRPSAAAVVVADEASRSASAPEDDPIVVVAMSCRYPGGLDSPEALWRLVVEGKDAISDFPTNRGWPSTQELFDPDPEAKGKTYVRKGGFLHDADEFDPAFFGISRREAVTIDPQHRLLLETAWEAFERGGITPASLLGSKTGVFVGASYGGYGGTLLLRAEEYEGFLGIGSAPSIASGRIAYTFGLQGPAVTLDTACSSSLVALHLACQALRNGECSIALAGGVMVMATPASFIEFSRQRALAPDGRCKAFAQSADGTAWAEGCGMLLVERLSDARRNGHPVLAVIRGSAVNQDGKSQGITAPNGLAQQQVIAQALASAGLRPSDVDAVEAHGTGTPLGDPIEAEALLATYGQGHSAERPLWLGSIKTNIGHTQAAAGIAGIMKMVQAFEHRTLPKTLHVDSLSPHVDWSEGTVRLLNDEVAWPSSGQPRRAAVSAFGISGTNAHVILEEPPSVASHVDSVVAVSPVLPFGLSAKSEPALRRQAARLRAHVEAHPDMRLVDIAYSLATTRSHFDQRAVAVAAERGPLLEALASLANSAPSAHLVVGSSKAAGKLAVLFTGQGSQYAGMGQALHDALPAFRSAFDAVCSELDRHLAPKRIRDVVFAPSGSKESALLDETELTQPALFAIEVALFRLFEGWGMRPDLLLGHSVGEIAAAHVSGMLSISDACKLVVARGRLMQALPRGGAMVALQATEEEVVAALVDAAGRVDIASCNGPTSTVIAGDELSVLDVAGRFEARGRKTSRLNVSHAFHSSHMDAMLDAFAEVVRGLRFESPRIPIVSTLTGMRASAVDLTSTEYWVRQTRQTVRFSDAVRSLESEGAATFLELGPRGVLCAMAQECLREDSQAGAAFVPALRSDRSEVQSLVTALGHLHTRGLVSDWSALFATAEPRRVPLPTYGFDRERFWLDPLTTKSVDLAAAGLGPSDHPLIGATIAIVESDSFVFTGRLSVADHPWLADSSAFGSVLFPASGFIELVMAAGIRVGLDVIDELTIDVPLVLPAKDGVHFQLHVGAKQRDGRRKWTLDARRDGASMSEETWTRHAAGELGPSSDAPPADLAVWPPSNAMSVSVDGVYERMAARGCHYGDGFRGLESMWRRGAEIFAEVRLPELLAREAHEYVIHPALLEAALQPLAHLQEDTADVAFTFEWSGVRVLATGASMLRVQLSPGEAIGAYSVALADAGGHSVASISLLRAGALSAEDIHSSAARGNPSSLYRVEWTSLPQTAPDPQPLRWALRGEDAFGVRAGVEKAGLELEPIDAAAPLQDGAADVLVVCRAAPNQGLNADAVRREAHQVLGLVQTWLASQERAAKQLVIVTRHAVSMSDDEPIVDLANASAWGLVRAAQSENADASIILVDVAENADLSLLPSAIASGETQLAIRRGAVLVPRLIRVRDIAGAQRPAHPLERHGTVLITGGTGALGGLVARHLVARHDVRHLLLASRQGTSAPGAAALLNELKSMGAHVAMVSCDVANADALRELLAAIPTKHPLTAVIHTAGVTDDGLIESLTDDRIDRVFTPKADAAIHLHQLTEHMNLSAFVLFSSVAGVAGAPGQANYAAANAFLDALAQHRHSRGLPASSLAWGYWGTRGALTGHMTEAHVTRLARLGIEPLSPEQGLTLFDAAIARPEPVLAPVRLDLSALRRMDVIPPLLRALVRAPLRRAGLGAGGATSLAKKLAPLPPDERSRILLEIVRAEAAAVLSSASAAIDPGTPLKDYGLDSLMAVELRNRLAAATGLRLPVTVLFDYPTASALGRFLSERLSGQLRRAVVATVQRAVLEDDPIVIVAMSCRYPGGADSPEALWNLITEGRSAITDFPSNRGWKVEEIYDPDPDASGKTYTRRGGFLHDADQFDAAFFGISAHEARGIDPQQRLLLETSWEAIERAGIDPISLQGSQTGVFVGVSHTDYALLQNLDDLDGAAGLGSLPSIASGRIAYTLGLHGPTLTVDTACSSSLVTIHLAIQALRNGECTLALAGGVNVMATPAPFIIFSRQRVLAPDGQCKPFSAHADGTSWAEGAGMLLLERLSDARRNGHPVLATLRGSAVNQDGKSQGLTAPNGPAQERVIEQALQNANISASEVDVVEAHGTGTSLGDPIEAHALFATYGRGRSTEDPVLLGTVKANIGHTQAAAGVAAVIKMVLALKHGVVPRTLHADTPSGHIDWSAGTIRLVGDSIPWKRNGRARRAGVSSFGISGTNAHLVIEEAPLSGEASSVADTRAMPAPVVLSAKSEASLRAQSKALSEHLRKHLDVRIDDLAFSLATTRAHFTHRVAFVASTTRELASALEAFAGGIVSSDALRSTAAEHGKLALLFSGQGSQHAGMGRQLYESFPTFRRAVDACAARFDTRLARPLFEALFSPSGSPASAMLDTTLYAQPALFSLEVALFRLLESWGVRPDYLVGHSLGEIVAAHIAGVFSLEDACTLVLARAQLMQKLPDGGGMLSVGGGVSELAPLLEQYAGRLDIAATNTPTSTVVSGTNEALLDLQRRLQTSGLTATRLKVSHAFHSHLLEPMLEDLRRVVGALSFDAPRIPIVSNLSGGLAEPSELQDPEYWVRHVRHAVRFSDCVRTLAALDVRTMVEVGPHTTLGALAQDTLLHDDAPSVAVVHSLRRDVDEVETVCRAVAAIHSGNHPLDWPRFFDGREARRIELPTYAFQRERFWLDGRRPHSLDAVLSTPRRRPLLGMAGNEVEPQSSVFTRPLRDTLQFDPFALAPETTLARAGIDSLGIVNIKSTLAALPGGKAVARRLTPLTPLAELLPFMNVATASETLATVSVSDNVDWQEVSPQSVNKQRDENVLLLRAGIRENDGTPGVVAELKSNREHPFFYERPLDHVPGLYLIEAVRQLGNWLVFMSKGQLEKGGTLDHVEADFFEYVEHGPPAYLVTLRAKVLPQRRRPPTPCS